MKTKLFFTVLVITFFMTSIMLASSFALAKRPSGPAGKSNIAHLYLYQKDPTTWEKIEDGAWGKLTYNPAGSKFKFIFNGHRLKPNVEYSLIYYANPWPGNHPGALLDSGVSNDEGDLHLGGSVELNMDLPDPGDGNYPYGAKIWLVPSKDYDAANCMMIAWNPAEYLFEEKLITYDDVDVP